MPKHHSSAKLPVILEQMAPLQSMERGTLSEEYRERDDGQGGKVKFGPYFKHQIWEGGGNKSRRVPSEEAPQLREDIENYKRFSELSDSYVNLAIEASRARRSQAKAGADPDAKKNFAKKFRPKAFGKRKPS